LNEKTFHFYFLLYNTIYVDITRDWQPVSTTAHSNNFSF